MDNEEKIIDMTPKPKAPWRRALKAYKEHFPENAALQVSLLFFAAAATALGFLAPSIVVISIPLIFLPFLFSAQIQSVSFLRNEPLSNKRLFAGFSAYFIRPFSGCYRAVWNMVRSILIGVLLSLVVIFASYSAFASDPSFVESLDNFAGFVAAGDLLSAYELISTPGAFQTFCLISVFSEAAFIFVLAMFFYINDMPNVEIKSRLTMLTSRGAHFIKRNVKMEDPSYVGQFHLSMWPVYLLVIAGFVGGGAITYFAYGGAMTQRLNFTVAGAVAGGMALFVLCAPYVFYVSHYIVEDRKDLFKKAAYEAANRTLHAAQMEEAMRRDFLDNLNRAVEDAEREEEERKKREEEDKKDGDGTDDS